MFLLSSSGENTELEGAAHPPRLKSCYVKNSVTEAYYYENSKNAVT